MEWMRAPDAEAASVLCLQRVLQLSSVDGSQQYSAEALEFLIQFRVYLRAVATVVCPPLSRALDRLDRGGASSL